MKPMWNCGSFDDRGAVGDVKEAEEDGGMAGDEGAVKLVRRRRARALISTRSGTSLDD